MKVCRRLLRSGRRTGKVKSRQTSLLAVIPKADLHFVGFLIPDREYSSKENDGQ